MVGGIENRAESMPKTRKSHPPSLKVKVGVEAIKAQDGRPDRADVRRPPDSVWSENWNCLNSCGFGSFRH
jgi:hypothetical protein